MNNVDLFHKVQTRVINTRAVFCVLFYNSLLFATDQVKLIQDIIGN